MRQNASRLNVHGINVLLLRCGLDKSNFKENIHPLLFGLFDKSSFHIKVSYQTLATDIQNLFRDMDLDRRYFGVAYIGRIKTFDDFKCEDELYGIVYKGDSRVDYTLFASVCSIHNNKHFYSRKINKTSSYFTMRDCLSAVKNFPKLGNNGFTMLDHPMTFAEFGKLAYEKSILSDSSGYSELCIDAEHNENRSEGQGDAMSDELSAMTDSVRKRANSLFVSKERATEETDVVENVEREEVISCGSDEYTNETIDSLRERCAISDSKVEALESDKKKMNETIATFKAQLESVKDSNVQFMSSADLQEARNRAIRADNASDIVSGLKDEFKLLKGISNKLAVLSTMKEGDTEQINLINSLKESIITLNGNVARSFIAVESMMSQNATKLSADIHHIWDVLQVFGISKDNPHTTNIPESLSSLTKIRPFLKTKDAATQATSPVADNFAQTISSSFCMSRWGPEKSMIKQVVGKDATQSNQNEGRIISQKYSRSGSSSSLPYQPHPGSPPHHLSGSSYQRTGYRGEQTCSAKSSSIPGPFTPQPSNNNSRPRSTIESIWENPPPSLKRSSDHTDGPAQKRN